MGKNNIYDKNLGYTLLRPIVDYHVRHSYRKVEVYGKENIPTDGAVILAPNHCNTLMDALVVLRSDKGSTVFGARADMFKHPFIASIMYFLRILPMVRQRDGLRNVLKNHETTDIIVDTLHHRVPFCIFPEGKHRPMHSLQVLGKGVFRAALQANSTFGNEMPVYIVPVGIEYGDYFRYRSTALVTYGKAINVTELANKLEVENEAQLMEPLRKELAEGIQGLITYIKDDEDYASKWELTKIRALGFKGTLHEKMLHNREIVADIERKIIENPEKMAGLLDKVSEFEKKRKRKGISIYSFGKKNLGLNVIGKSLLAILGLPYFIFSAIVALPLWGISAFLKTKIKDKAFRNTAAFGTYLAGELIFGLIWTVLAFCLAPWPYALAFVALMLTTYPYFNDYLEFMRRLISDCRLLGNKKLRKTFKSFRQKIKTKN